MDHEQAYVFEENSLVTKEFDIGEFLYTQIYMQHKQKLK